MTTSYIDEVISALPPSGDNARDDRGLPIMSSLGLDIPLSTVSLPSPSSVVGKARKSSLLGDLIESENAYVELLTGIVRKVASAWSRSNLPPPELDVIFRSVEGVYKTNRTLLAKLKEIGENPSSPKALGDLLMRWIDELEHPYTTYADQYCMGFDNWEPVKSNAKLPSVLQAFSTSNPPPSALPEPSRLLNPSLWTLDALFVLPKGRLQYYKKLYSRLLKSTTPGRSDHRLLTGALGKLDSLLATLEDRAKIYVGAALPPPRIPLLSHTSSGPNLTTVIPIPSYTNEQVEGDAPCSERSVVNPTSITIPLQPTFSSGDERFSQEATLISPSQESSRAISSPLLDLERRLATDHTLDIFTMQLKQIRLQIIPPTLPYARELRLTVKVAVRFTPKATGVEVIHPQGRIYILSDLYLLCEEMTREERIARAEDARDMHLCYPPLSGKVLEVVEVPGQDNALQVSIMRKERMVLQADSRSVRDRILNEFQDCISYAKMISGAAQEPVPPMPPSGNPPQSPATRHRTRERPDRGSIPRSLPQSQPANVMSEYADGATSLMDGTPASSPKQNVGSNSQHNIEQQHVTLPQLETVQNSGRDAVIRPLSRPPSSDNGQRAPTEPVYPSRRSSRAHNSPPSSFVPGQIIPPVWSASSMQSQSPPFGLPPPDLPGGPSEPLTAQNYVLQNPALKHHASMHSLRQQPLRHQPSSPSHKPHQQNFHPGPHPQLASHPSNTQPFTSHPSSPPVTSYSVEQSFPRLHKSSSSRSLHAQYQYSQTPLPPLPSLPDGLPIPQRPYSGRKDSMGSLNAPMSRPLLPSMQMGSRTNSIAEPSILDPSPPTSPAAERKPLGPVRSVITAQMKCKVFQQQQHAQWKSLGSANLTLYREEPTNVKQLVVEAGSKEKSILISTIVLTDGVERVGKTGVAIELSGSGGARTGVIYMIQLRNEDAASNLFKTLLAGSDRAT